MITNRKRNLLENNKTAVACSRDRAGAAKVFHLAVLDLEAEVKPIDQLGSRKKRPEFSHLRAPRIGDLVLLGLLTAYIFAVEVSWGHLKEEEQDQEQALLTHDAQESGRAVAF